MVNTVASPSKRMEPIAKATNISISLLGVWPACVARHRLSLLSGAAPAAATGIDKDGRVGVPDVRLDPNLAGVPYDAADCHRSDVAC